MKRKDFIKKGLMLSAGAFAFMPAFSRNEARAAELITPESKPLPNLWKAEDIDVTWIGHATVLINFFGIKILTDPVLFDSVGLYFMGLTIGPRRYTYPALSIDEMIKPDIVLLSHAHMDHMDYKTLLSLTDKYPGQIDCITAKNTFDVINELEWKSLKEVDWNEELIVNNIKFRALEVQHFGWRYPWEKDRSRGFTEGRSFNAYLMEMNDKKIIFGGDTAYTDKFKEAALGEVDIAIMPIGAYNPWNRVHANPEQSLIMASQHMRAKYIVPIHYYTFHQGQEPIDEPIKWLKESSTKYKIQVGIEKLGETLNLPYGIV